MSKSEIDNRIFYKQILTIGAPVMLQNLIQALVNMLDVFMIGQLGEAEITAVGMGAGWISLLFFLFNGICAAGGVFIVQYWGKQDLKSIHSYMGLMFVLNTFCAVLFTVFTWYCPELIMSLYSKDPDVIALGCTYLKIISVNCLLNALIRVAVVALSSTEQTVVPMVSTILSLGVNLVLNYVFIFGHFGIPAMGVAGAAVATVIALLIQTVYLFSYSWYKKYPICAPLKEYFQIPKENIQKYFRHGSFLILCEIVFAIGNNIYNIGYKYTGTNAQAALQIINTLQQLAMIAALGIGTAAGIMLGKLMGENKLELVKIYSRRFMILVPVVAGIFGIIVALGAPYFLHLFHLGDEALGYTQKMLFILALTLPFRAENNVIVAGILRSGGDSWYCFLANFVGNWCVGIPMVFFGTLVLHLPIHWLYLLVATDELGKLVIGLPRALSYKWIKNLT